MDRKRNSMINRAARRLAVVAEERIRDELRAASALVGDGDELASWLEQQCVAVRLRNDDLPL